MYSRARSWVWVSLLVACSGGDDGSSGPPPDPGGDTPTADTLEPDDAAGDNSEPTDSGAPETTPGDTGDTASTDTPVGDTSAGDTSATDTARPDAVVNPCGDIPVRGRCEGNTLAVCVVGTGSSEPFVRRETCPLGTRCGAGQYGATCVLATECVEYSSECRGSTLAYCEGGRWVTESCAAGCRAHAIGASCRPTLPTATYVNTVDYELKVPNDGFTDWGSELYVAPAVGFLVLSYINDELVDATETDAQGGFQVQTLAANLQDDDDYLILMTVGIDPSDKLPRYSVVSPEVGPGLLSVDDLLDAPPPDAIPHYWFIDPRELPSGSELYLPIDAGSGVAHAFDYLRFVHVFAHEFYGARPGTELVMWLGLGNRFDCGACFIRYPTEVFGDRYEAQIFMPGDAENESYWSSAVIAHELGHWLMATYGVSPGEGGTHIIGIPSHPGLAWSEGFATWFSMLARGESYYYDKQDGLFFWVDVGERTYGTGQPWNRPQASLGLEQLIDENEVARMLLDLTDGATLEPMLGALSSSRMTQAPFGRGYVRRTWDDLDADGLPRPWSSTGESAPHFADFLDALVCEGVHTPNEVDIVTAPSLHYPFPSRQPVCRHGDQPLAVTWRKSATGWEATVRWFVTLPAQLVLEVAGMRHVVPADSKPGSLSLEAPGGVRVTLDSAAWRVHGLARPPLDQGVRPAPPWRTNTAKVSVKGGGFRARLDARSQGSRLGLERRPPGAVTRPAPWLRVPARR